MAGICLAAGATAAFLATSEFVLAWQHSVEHVRWEERYRVEGDTLRLVEASVQGSGAGMEPGPGARLIDGRWVWRPAIAPLRELRLAASDYTADYELCVHGRCMPLSSVLKIADEGVTLRACRGLAPAAPGAPH